MAHANQDPAVDYFYSAAKRRFRSALWSIFAPALMRVAAPSPNTVLHLAKYRNQPQQRGLIKILLENHAMLTG